MATTTDPIVIRLATDRDAAAIERLARLDSARVPAGDLLVGEVGGELRAAVRVNDRAAIADPFHHTAGLVTLLAARADHLAGRRGSRSGTALRAQVRRLGAPLRPSL